MQNKAMVCLHEIIKTRRPRSRMQSFGGRIVIPARTSSKQVFRPWAQEISSSNLDALIYRIDPRAPVMYPIVMCKAVLKLLWALLLICAFLAVDLRAQQGQQEQSGEESAYGSKFFDQLRSIFGRFRDADLQRVFQEAQPIQCSELVGRKGEWRSVAFFNEDRRLGDWYRERLEEVKSDLSVYTFKGVCGGDQGTVQVATEFPTAASIDAYKQRRIDLDQVDVTVNDPVNAVLNPRTMAYTFELPYLFLTERNPTPIYGFYAPNRDSAYAKDVASRWECKTVSSKDVTYRFLICRTAIIPQGKAARNQKWDPVFGSSAFFILSDGTEVITSVNLTFGDGTRPTEKPADTAPAPTPGSPTRPLLKRKE